MLVDEVAVGSPLSPLSSPVKMAASQSPLGKSITVIPYKTVIQTRQEMALVKVASPIVNTAHYQYFTMIHFTQVALQRHRRGELADYVTEENFNDLATSGKLPSVFYKDVPCCENCFKIYSVIEDARSRALAKIIKAKEWKSSSSGKSPTSTGSFSPTGLDYTASTSANTHSTSSFSQGTKKPNETIAHPRASEQGAEDSLKVVK